MSDPHKPVRIQNQSLSTGLSGMADYYSMERNEFARKSDRLPILGYINMGLIVLYAVVFFVMLLVLFLKATSLSLHIRFLIAAIFALYPFFIYTVENAAIQMYYYVYSIIYGQSYHEIMARKGIQNPKNYRDVENLGRTIQKGAEVGIDYMKRLQAQTADLKSNIDNLPNILKTQFGVFLLFFPFLPDDMQLAYIDLQGTLVGMYQKFETDLPTYKINQVFMEMANMLEAMKQKVNDFIALLYNDKMPSSIIDSATEKVMKIYFAAVTQTIQFYMQYIVNQLIPANSPEHTPSQVAANTLRTSQTYTFSATTSKFLPMIYDYQDDMNDTIQKINSDIQGSKGNFQKIASNYNTTISTIHQNVMDNIKAQSKKEGMSDTDLLSLPIYLLFSNMQVTTQYGLLISERAPAPFGGMSDPTLQQTIADFDNDYIKLLLDFQGELKGLTAGDSNAAVVAKYQPKIKSRFDTLFTDVGNITTISQATIEYVQIMISGLRASYNDTNIQNKAKTLKDATPESINISILVTYAADTSTFVLKSVGSIHDSIHI